MFLVELCFLFKFFISLFCGLNGNCNELLCVNKINLNGFYYGIIGLGFVFDVDFI